MNKHRFKITEIFTPKDHSLNRTRHSHTFITDNTNPYEITKIGFMSISINNHVTKILEDAKKQIFQLWSSNHINNVWSFISDHKEGEYYYLIEQEVPGPCTPLDSKSIHKWAKNYPGITKTLIAKLLHLAQMESLKNYKQSELIEYLDDILWEGVKCYKDMTLSELLISIDDGVLENFNASTLEELPFYDTLNECIGSLISS